jgi:DNA-binding YbaB/EbfC family protein
VEGSAGGELVKVTLNGHLHLVGLSIDPAAFDPDDPTILEDLVLAAWKDAHDDVAELQAQSDPLGGLGGLGGGLGDLLGGG